VVATPDGPVIFYKLGRIRHLRRIYAERRKKLQKAGKHRAVRKLGRKEHCIVTAINYAVSKDIVSLARRQGAGIRLEDLSGIRQSAKQHKARKADAGQNRDYRKNAVKPCTLGQGYKAHAVLSSQTCDKIAV
jgi:hypothetical protein